MDRHVQNLFGLNRSIIQFTGGIAGSRESGRSGDRGDLRPRPLAFAFGAGLRRHQPRPRTPGRARRRLHLVQRPRPSQRPRRRPAARLLAVERTRPRRRTIRPRRRSFHRQAGAPLHAHASPPAFWPQGQAQGLGGTALNWGPRAMEGSHTEKIWRPMLQRM